MLVFSAITPHSPLLLPTIGHDQEKKLSATLAAFRKLQQNFEKSKPDVVIFISPHGEIIADAFSINLHEVYEGDLSQFGDLATRPQFFPDNTLIEKLKRNLRKNKLPVAFTSSHYLDYGIIVPAILLSMTKFQKIIPIGHSPTLDYKTHFNAGGIINDEIFNSTKRIAIIASTDLSHRLSSDSPAGFSPKGEEFDKIVISSIETRNTARLLSLEPEFINEASSCGFKSILMLLGILSETSYSSKILSYEHPFGIGYMTVKFEL